jgi:hypothetical protein
MIRRLIILLLIVGCGTEPTSTHHELEQEDCAGVAGGTAIEDECGVCGGGIADAAKLFNLDNFVFERGVTNSAPLLVRIVFILTPSFFKSLINSRLLYAAIPPQIINKIFLLFKLLME